MYSRVYSGTWEGIDGVLIEAEADVSNGLPVFEMVGYLSSEAKEAKERVRTALKNQGYRIPPKRITVNLSPAHIRKSGTGYDLAIAISILIAGEYLPPPEELVLFLGEVGLGGNLKEVNGVLPIVLKAKEEGVRLCILPKGNVKEGLLAEGICVAGAGDIREAAEIFRQFLISGDKEEYLSRIRQVTDLSERVRETVALDFSEIKGHTMAKRAIEIAVSGQHNLLMTGPPGSGKSALAKRVPTIMPKMSYEEKLELTKIYSVSGKRTQTEQLMEHRPFRNPHHSVTCAALAGGGSTITPGEVSLAHHGVLFLDELPEFKRPALEILRQPMEEGEIFLSRSKSSCVLPADFMLIAAMNPCPCGYYPDYSRCLCSDRQKINYWNKISGPLLDRIDMMVRVENVPYEERRGIGKEESSDQIRQRVEAVREIQRKRYAEEGILVNARLNEKLILHYCQMEEDAEKFLDEVMRCYDFSYRGYVRILKLARTIADMDGTKKLKREHVEEAVLFRMGRIYGKGNQ